MARIRSIHPDICIDKGLAELDDARAERTFMRLWTYCDDDGRAIDDPRLIKAALFPRLDSMTVEAVGEDLAVLASAGFIVRYRAGDEDYLYVPSFARWQKPNRKVDSKLPPPPSSEDSVSAHCDAPPVVVVGVVVGDVDIAPPAACATHTSDLVPVENLPPPDPAVEPDWQVTPAWDTFADALAAACLMDRDRMTEREVDQVRLAGRQLRGAGATIAGIGPAARRYREMFNVPLTPMAMASHWSKLTGPSEAPPPDPRVTARQHGIARAKQGIYASEDEARDDFEATFQDQPELVACALEGWADNRIEGAA